MEEARFSVERGANPGSVSVNVIQDGNVRVELVLQAPVARSIARAITSRAGVPRWDLAYVVMMLVATTISGVAVGMMPDVVGVALSLFIVFATTWNIHWIFTRR